LEQYKLPFIGSAFDVFQEMNRRGKLLLILDGFDEMAQKVNYKAVVDNFLELTNLIDEDSKVVLTSRTSYFHWAKESEKIMGVEEYGNSTIAFSSPKFEELNLEPFSNDQIRHVIVQRKGKEHGHTLADRILNKEYLAEMARKPVLVELILAALDEANEEEVENLTKVYHYAINKLLLRNIYTKRTFTSIDDKLYFLCELAWEMINSNKMRIHYTAIPERIRNYFNERIKENHELDIWDYDLRSQTLLHRDAKGYYEFAHTSLAEYFASLKIEKDIECGKFDLGPALNSPQIWRFLEDMLDASRIDINKLAQAIRAERNIITQRHLVGIAKILCNDELASVLIKEMFPSWRHWMTREYILHGILMGRPLRDLLVEALGSLSLNVIPEIDNAINRCIEMASNQQSGIWQTKRSLEKARKIIVKRENMKKRDDFKYR